MGDRRFARPYEALRDAPNRAEALRALPDTHVIEALAHASREKDPLIANVLATEASNRMERARTIYENLWDGLVSVDARGHIVSINPAAAKMLGWAHNDLMGKDKHETIHYKDERGNAVHKEDCQMLHVLRTGDVAKSDRDVLVRRDGSTFPISFTAAPVRVGNEITGLVIAFRDITRQEAQEVEKASWLNLVDAVYHVHDELGIGMLIVDDGRIYYANDAFRAISGYSLEEVKAEVPNVFALVDAEDRASFKARLADIHVRGATPRPQTVKLIRRDGSTARVEVRVAKVNHQPGKVSRLVFVVRPV